MKTKKQKEIKVAFSEMSAVPYFSNLIQVESLGEQFILNFIFVDKNNKQNAIGIFRVVISSNNARQLGEILLENDFNKK